ncbi:MAG: acetate--CoA ligase family protein [Candidatus Odinarchaeota archaeon]|nr:acetate--CoA ligase family protein [Candidatus Odinarchaeota archaeon]
MARNEEIARIIEKAKKEKRFELNEIEAKTIVSSYGISVAKTTVAKNEDEAVKIANEIGYPVVLKIFSPDVLHKSDVGGVKINLKSDSDVKNAFNEIINNVKKHVPNAKIEGVVVQEFAPQGLEVIIGGIYDKFFGPTIMFGLGGVWVEILKDVTFRLAPIDKQEAEDMIKEIKGYPLLTGYRGSPPVDLDALKDALVKASQLMNDFQEIGEMDLNPTMAYEKGKGIKVVDARIILRKD